MNAQVATKYGQLSKDEIESLVIDDKWLQQIAATVDSELQQVSTTLSSRLKTLSDRYEQTLSTLTAIVAKKTQAVEGHLKRMGASW